MHDCSPCTVDVNLSSQHNNVCTAIALQHVMSDIIEETLWAAPLGAMNMDRACNLLGGLRTCGWGSLASSFDSQRYWVARHSALEGRSLDSV